MLTEPEKKYLLKQVMLKEERIFKKRERKLEEETIFKLLRGAGWKLRYINGRYSGTILSIAYRDKPPYLCAATAKSSKDMHHRAVARKILLEKINRGETFLFLEGNLVAQSLLDGITSLLGGLTPVFRKVSGRFFNKEISLRIISCLLSKIKTGEFKIPKEWKKHPSIWEELITEELLEDLSFEIGEDIEISVAPR